ncbi:MAG: YjjG family noncanonical pyrimidine nucleotidase [Cyclobacteriaceae bacterium]
MKKYKHLFFDLDHTLWDHDKNSEEAIDEIHARFSLDTIHSIPKDAFRKTFSEINTSLWDQFNHGTLHQTQLRASRFRLILDRFGVRNESLDHQLGEAYLNICPTKNYLLPFALDLLNYLKPKYTMHILTNGFIDVQKVKISSAGISPYFQHIITADLEGNRKPNKEIFLHALNISSAKLEESLMIGDNPDTDILGAINVGMDCVYYNPQKRKHNFAITHEISCLSDLFKVL